MPPRTAKSADRRCDPTVPGSTQTYTAQEFNKFYGPDRGPLMFKRAGGGQGKAGGNPPPLRAVKGAAPKGGKGGAPQKKGGKLQLTVGQKVKATGRLLGDQGQVVKAGALGKVTAVPGPKVRLERSAIAEVRIGGVTFDATRDMIELIQDRPAAQDRPVKPRLAPAPPPRSRGPRAAPQMQQAIERRQDPTMKPNEKGANKTYTKEQFNQFYGKDATKLWKKAGGKAAKVAPKKPAGPEKRPDTTVPAGTKGAGKTYTKEEFVQFYGKEQAAKMWQKGGKILAKKEGVKKTPVKAPAGPEKRQDPTVQKSEKGFGKTYTQEQFDKFYGAKDAKALWKKAAGKTVAKAAPVKMAKDGKKAKKDAVEKHADPTVEKGQKGFGKTYTKEQFVEFYGAKAAAKLWKKSAPAPEKKGKKEAKKEVKKEKEVEKRPDPTFKPDQKGAKKSYTKEEFVAFYGKEAATKLWKEAASLVPKKKEKDGKKKTDDKKKDDKKKEDKPKKEKKVRDPPQLEEVTMTIKRTEGQSLGWERNPKNQRIVSVDAESPAATAGLAKGMRIAKIAGKEVTTDEEVKEALKAAGAEFEITMTKKVEKPKEETKKE